MQRTSSLQNSQLETTDIKKLTKEIHSQLEFYSAFVSKLTKTLQGLVEGSQIKTTLVQIKLQAAATLQKMKQEVLEGREMMESLALYFGFSVEEKDNMVKDCEAQSNNINITAGGGATSNPVRRIQDFEYIKSNLGSVSNIPEKVDLRYINFRFSQIENFDRGNDIYVQIQPILEERTLAGDLLKGCCNYFDQIVGFTGEEFFQGSMDLRNSKATKSTFSFIPGIVQTMFISEKDLLMKIDGGNHYILCHADVKQFKRSFKQIAKIPKLDDDGHQTYEELIINRKCTSVLYFSESESDSNCIQMKLLCLVQGQNFLTDYEAGIEKEKSEMSTTFFGFAQNSDIVEFNMNSKTGLLHKVQLWMVTRTTEIKAPYSWNSSEILKIVIATGQGTCLVYLSDHGVRSLTLADIRSNGDSLMLTALHTKNFNDEEKVLDIRIKQLGKYYNYIVAITTEDKLEIVNYVMGQYNLTDNRFFVEVDHKIYNIIFVKGYFFFVFSDGSVSHINHDFFFKFKVKE